MFFNCPRAMFYSVFSYVLLENYFSRHLWTEIFVHCHLLSQVFTRSDALFRELKWFVSFVKPLFNYMQNMLVIKNLLSKIQKFALNVIFSFLQFKIFVSISSKFANFLVKMIQNLDLNSKVSVKSQWKYFAKSTLWLGAYQREFFANLVSYSMETPSRNQI